jgi:hypothetical protein
MRKKLVQRQGGLEWCDVNTFNADPSLGSKFKCSRGKDTQMIIITYAYLSTLSKEIDNEIFERLRTLQMFIN